MKYVIYVGGGLANKMFHVAFAIALEKQGKEVLYDDFSFNSEFCHDRILISDVFPRLGIDRMPKGLYHHGGDNSLRAKILRRIPFLTGEKYYISHSVNYDESFVKSIVRPGYIIGSFQNENYFCKYKSTILERFEFRPFEDEKNLNLTETLKSSNSVAIHIRKGDGYATWNKFVGTCPVDYYKKAINYIEKSESSLKYYIFTDSPNWVKDNMNWLDYNLIDWNPSSGYGNHYDMQLMSYCKHNIIANSTYSWWAAWLNGNRKKIVVAPKTWFNLNSKIKRQPDIISKGWISL